MEMHVRGEPSTIDAPWMTQALEAAGVAQGATVMDLSFEGLIGTGQMSRNARFRLAWDRSEGRPATVVGKFPSADPPTREGSFSSGAYRSEVAFYRDVAATVDVRTPRCWVARIDEARGDFVLIMEDLVDSAQGDQFTGCSPDQVSLALEQAVALHAPRWGDSRLTQEPALQPVDDGYVDLISNYYRAAVPICLDRLGDRFDDEVITLVERFAALVDDWARGPGAPATVVHGDFRPDNFLFGETTQAPPLAVVDWQTVHKGLGLTDVAYLLGGALPPEERRSAEVELVEEYRERLNAAGVDHPAGLCWRDYRWGTLHGLFIAVCATMAAEQTERGDEMLALMALRHARHALDLEAAALLEDVATGYAPSR